MTLKAVLSNMSGQIYKAQSTFTLHTLPLHPSTQPVNLGLIGGELTDSFETEIKCILVSGATDGELLCFVMSVQGPSSN